MAKVCVLLSAYNGEKYLEAQLQSLVRQRNVDLDVIVRDDGSTDNTYEILSRWEKTGKIRCYTGENLGWAMSFMHLVLNAPEYDYYAFCDQDDIWHEDKLYVALESLKKDETVPSCYFSNLTYWKEGVPLKKVYGSNLYFDRYTCLVQCPAYGCTMVFNKCLADIIKGNPPVSVSAHDFWVYQTAVLTGTVYYDSDSYILYRQHGNNQEGALKSYKEIWSRRFKKSLPRILNQHPIEYNVKELIRCYRAYISDETYLILRGISEYRTSSKAYFSLIFSRKYKMSRFENNIWLKLKVILGRL